MASGSAVRVPGSNRSTAITLTLRIDGARELLRDLSRLDRSANDRIRAAAVEIAEDVARQVRVAGKVEGRQAAIVADTVRARRDRVPVVQAGGARRIGRRRKPAYKLLFGSEFGATHLPQYRPHRGREGYWFFPTVERNDERVAQLWTAAAEDLLDELRPRGGDLR